MNLFKKKPIRCDNLVFVNPEGHIQFSSELPGKITWLIQEIQDSNYLWDDKLYQAVYKHYLKYHSVYDRFPLLLYFKVPVIAYDVYGPKKLLVEPENFFLSVGEIKNNIGTYFRIPKELKDVIMECYDKTDPYRKPYKGEFEEELEGLYLMNWELLLTRNETKVRAFWSAYSLKRINQLIEDAKPDCQNIIRNIITRVTDNKRHSMG